MKSIALIGFMGSGKSTIGKGLSEKMQLPLVDLDQVIVDKIGMSIDAYFAQYGEPAFRDLEQDTLLECVGGGNTILSTGGGTPTRASNQKVLAEHCYRITLLATPEVIAARVRQDEIVRPLLSNLKETETMEQRIASILEPRMEWYRQTDLCVETSHRSVDEIVEEIYAYIMKREGGQS